MKKLLMLLLLVAGCSPHLGDESVDFGEGAEDQLLLVIQQDGVFRERLGAKVDAFAMAVLEKYFRGKADGRLIIAQTTDKERLIWEGTARDLKDQFKSPKELRAFILSKAAPKVRLYESLRRSIQYFLTDDMIKSGRARVAVILISDMVDEESDEKEEGYLNHQLSELAWRKGNIALYFCSDDQILRWHHRLVFYGLKPHVTGDQVLKPKLPNFD